LSVWTIPDEIVDAVAEIELKEKEDERKAQQEMLDKAARDEEAKQLEVDRIKKEMKGVIKRKADEETLLDEFVTSKKTKVESEDEDAEESEEEGEEEEWQREAAAQLAAEAEEERKRRIEEEEIKKKEAEADVQRTEAAGLINMPAKVDLSIEEAKALFKVRSHNFGNIGCRRCFTDAFDGEGHKSSSPMGYIIAQVR
jgi:hypothetical protein